MAPLHIALKWEMVEVIKVLVAQENVDPNIQLIHFNFFMKFSDLYFLIQLMILTFIKLTKKIFLFHLKKQYFNDINDK